MNKETIVETLEEKHQELLDWLSATDDELWTQGPKNRWTSGQHILHLVQSSQMLNKALRYPKFLLRYKFGTSNRPSRSYEAVAKRYEERLAENLEKAKKFNINLRVPSQKEKQQLMDDLQVLNKKLQYKTRKFKDKHLDTLLLPHPLMGRMTLREIIMWTAHHTEHHLEILKQDYSA
jgi:hypothetical protein